MLPQGELKECLVISSYLSVVRQFNLEQFCAVFEDGLQVSLPLTPTGIGSAPSYGLQISAWEGSPVTVTIFQHDGEEFLAQYVSRFDAKTITQTFEKWLNKPLTKHEHNTVYQACVFIESLSSPQSKSKKPALLSQVNVKHSSLH
jgi:hypothetical protein